MEAYKGPNVRISLTVAYPANTTQQIILLLPVLIYKPGIVIARAAAAPSAPVPTASNIKNKILLFRQRGSPAKIADLLRRFEQPPDYGKHVDVGGNDNEGSFETADFCTVFTQKLFELIQPLVNAKITGQLCDLLATNPELVGMFADLQELGITEDSKDPFFDFTSEYIDNDSDDGNLLKDDSKLTSNIPFTTSSFSKLKLENQFGPKYHQIVELVLYSFNLKLQEISVRHQHLLIFILNVFHQVVIHSSHINDDIEYLATVFKNSILDDAYIGLDLGDGKVPKSALVKTVFTILVYAVGIVVPNIFSNPHTKRQMFDEFDDTANTFTASGHFANNNISTSSFSTAHSTPFKPSTVHKASNATVNTLRSRTSNDDNNTTSATTSDSNSTTNTTAALMGRKSNDKSSTLENLYNDLDNLTKTSSEIALLGDDSNGSDRKNDFLTASSRNTNNSKFKNPSQLSLAEPSSTESGLLSASHFVKANKTQLSLANGAKSPSSPAAPEFPSASTSTALPPYIDTPSVELLDYTSTNLGYSGTQVSHNSSKTTASSSSNNSKQEDFSHSQNVSNSNNNSTNNNNNNNNNDNNNNIDDTHTNTNNTTLLSHPSLSSSGTTASSALPSPASVISATNSANIVPGRSPSPSSFGASSSIPHSNSHSSLAAAGSPIDNVVLLPGVTVPAAENATDNNSSDGTTRSNTDNSKETNNNHRINNNVNSTPAAQIRYSYGDALNATTRLASTSTSISTPGSATASVAVSNSASASASTSTLKNFNYQPGTARSEGARSPALGGDLFSKASPGFSTASESPNSHSQYDNSNSNDNSNGNGDGNLGGTVGTDTDNDNTTTEDKLTEEQQQQRLLKSEEEDLLAFLEELTLSAEAGGNGDRIPYRFEKPLLQHLALPPARSAVLVRAAGSKH